MRQPEGGLSKYLLPLGVAAAVQWFQSATSAPAAPTQPPRNFDFLNQPSSSLMSKALSVFSGNSNSVPSLASPDIPNTAPHRHEPVPRMIPGVGYVNDNGGVISNGAVTTPPLLPPQSLVQTSAPSTLNVPETSALISVAAPPHRSVIAEAMRPVDGGLLAEVTSRLGIEDFQLDPMSKVLLKNVNNLVHIPHREREPMLLGMNYETKGNTYTQPQPQQHVTVPVTYNVFDDRTPPAVKRAIDEAPSFHLPPVHGVPFLDV